MTLFYILVGLITLLFVGLMLGVLCLMHIHQMEEIELFRKCNRECGLHDLEW